MEMIFLCFFIIVIIIAVYLIKYLLRPNKNESDALRLVLLESEKRQQEALFTLQKTMNSQIQQFQQTMMQSLHQDLTQLNESSTQRLFSMEKQVNHNLLQGYESTSKVFSEVMERMGKLDESQENLKELSRSIGSIQNVLTDKKTRGLFGEIELYSLLENAMGLPGQRYAKQYKLSTNVIADAVLFSRAPLEIICIDSKFPLENYNRIMDSSNDTKRAHIQFMSDVKKHIKAIADKYIIPQETADFAYMFIPAEAVFSYLYATCEDVITYSYELKVYLVSPTTLMAYITAIRAIYLDVERNENLALMQSELQLLHLEFERFKKRYDTFQNDFERSYQDMQQLSITARKLIHRFQEIEAVEIINKV